jgi:NADPH-dependent 2,4-dienoyl-CoA reductase/sulfur reductase-like enzyme
MSEERSAARARPRVIVVGSGVAGGGELEFDALVIATGAVAEQ